MSGENIKLLFRPPLALALTLTLTLTLALTLTLTLTLALTLTLTIRPAETLDGADRSCPRAETVALSYIDY